MCSGNIEPEERLQGLKPEERLNSFGTVQHISVSLDMPDNFFLVEQFDSFLKYKQGDHKKCS